MTPEFRGSAIAGLLVLAAWPSVASTVSFSDGSTTQPSQYTASVPQSTEVHVIGLYDGGSSGPDSNPTHTFIPGTTRVLVTGTANGPVSLVLSSYEATQWLVEGPGVTSLTSIVLNGFQPSTAVGIDITKVVNRSGQGNYLAACAYAWPSDTGGCNTPGLVAGVEGLFGVPIASFTARYTSSSRLGMVTSLSSPAAFQVNVALAPVPLPSALALLGPALAGLVMIRRRAGADLTGRPGGGP